MCMSKFIFNGKWPKRKNKDKNSSTYIRKRRRSICLICQKIIRKSYASKYFFSIECKIEGAQDFSMPTTDYGRLVRKSLLLYGPKSTPNPIFLGTADAYFVCHIGPNFQISLIYSLTLGVHSLCSRLLRYWAWAVGN